MSSPGGLQITGEPDIAAAEDNNGHNEENARDIEIHNFEEDNCPTSSKSPTLRERINASTDSPARKSRSSLKKIKHHPYKMQMTRHRYKGLSRGRPPRYLTNSENMNPEMIEITSEGSAEHIPHDYHRVKDVGNVNSLESFVCSLYITSFNALDDQNNKQLTIDPLADTLNKIASGKIRIQKTYCGIFVAFTREDDADKIMKLALQNIFNGPVQVARFQTGEYRFRQNVIIKDVPWCISNIEIHQALKKQGITAGRVIRTRAHVKIEVLNALDMYRLIEEGLNFFNYTYFTAVPENSVSQGEPDIIQCFKCQGFWHTSTHCRQMPRCVRCGDNHDVEYCPRPRNAPICCHCGGPHHAAYKMCPVRLQHINSTYVGFQLAKTKPVGPFMHNMF